MGILLAAVLMVADDGTLILKESVRVSGRFIRLTDLLDATGLTDSTRSRLDGIYLGRAPEEGRPRVLTSDDLRRELERRGVDPGTFAFVGKQVEVTSGTDLEPQRRALALEIQKHLKGEVEIVDMNPGRLPSGCRIAELHERGVLEFDVVLVDSEMKSHQVRAVGRAPRMEAPAVAEAAPEPVEPRSDRRESAGRRPASVRKGDVVRAISSAYEVDARALEDGAPGEEILLEFAASKNLFRARISGADRVEVSEVRR